MKSKRQWVIIISLIIILIGAGIGGKKYMDYKHEQEEETKKYQEREILNAEKAIVNDLARYEGVKKIQFTGWGVDDSTGEVSIAVKVNDKYKFGYAIQKDGDTYDPIQQGTDDNIPDEKLKKGHSSNINVIYKSRGEKR